MTPTRRDTLRLLAGSALALAAPLTWSPLALAATPDLVVIRGGDGARRVKAALDALGGISRFVGRGDKVVVKPNMGFGHPPDRGATTHPDVVRALCEQALSAGAKQVLVFDNPCHSPNTALDVCGVKAALADLDQTTVYPLRREDLFREVPVPAGVVLKTQAVALDILEADCIINVPTAKSHGSARVSFGMKNWMGVVQERRPWHLPGRLDQSIADIATLIRPKLTVVDATRALVTGGPGGPGKVEVLDTLLAGVDPVAVDAWALTLAAWGGKGYKPADVPWLGMAEKLGVGRADTSGLVVQETRI